MASLFRRKFSLMTFITRLLSSPKIAKYSILFRFVSTRTERCRYLLRSSFETNCQFKTVKNRFSSKTTISKSATRNVDDMIFDFFKNHHDKVLVSKFIVALQNAGLQRNDPRLVSMVKKFQTIQEQLYPDRKDAYIVQLDRENFKSCIQENIILITRALQNQFVILNWPEFTRQIEQIFDSCRSISKGKVADYIPQLATVNPDHWSVSICTIDGQRSSFGDHKVPWCLQSVSKPLTYGIAIHERGEEFVHSYVGQEPSGRLFNEICLNHNAKPHNPLINTGAIVIASLIKTDLKLSERFDFLLKKFKLMAAGEFVGYSDLTYWSERETADRNKALAYYMRQNKCFPEDGLSNLRQTLDLYFQLCSVEVTCESASVIAATLANGGVCPLTNEKVLNSRAVRDVLTLMYSCGMYNYSGQFAFDIGLPAKSGVSGGMILVIPNVMGIALWSPPLDDLGNPVRGLTFCQKLVESFNFHNYDNLVHSDAHKVDPRQRNIESRDQLLVNFLLSAASGDLQAIKRYIFSGVDMDGTVFDGRTALHLAASQGHLDVVKFLTFQCSVRHDIKDRWQRTALDDAKQFGHLECVKAIEDYTQLLLNLS